MHKLRGGSWGCRVSRGAVLVLAVAAAHTQAAASLAQAADLCPGLIEDKLPHAMTALAKPALGVAVVDPQFGTTLRRITSVANSGPNPAIKPMYSTVSAWNADESRLILYRVGKGHQLYDGRTYAFIRDLDDIRPADLEEVYWHTSDPDILFYVDSKDLMRYHVSTGVKDVVRRFDFCAGPADAGDDPMFTSWDSDKIGLTCGSRDFLYTIGTNTVSPLKTARSVAPQAAPSGTLAYWKGDVTDLNLNVLRNLGVDPFEHASLGRLANGRDTYNGVAFDGTFIGSLVTYDMTNGTGRVIVGPDTGYPYPPSGTHLSTMASRSQPGWVFVSIIGDPAGQGVLDSEIVLADTNPGGKVCRVAHHRSYGRANTNLRDAYWAEPHVMASPSGTRAIFASDWGNTSTVDTYVIELPGYNPGPGGADLSVVQTDAPDPVLVGNDVTYTLTVRNGGSAPATGVTLVDVLPPGLTFVSSSPGLPTCTATAGTVTCNLGTLSAGASTAVTIVASADVVGTYTVEATVTSTEPDSNPANNVDPEVTSVLPGLSIGDVTVTEGNSGTVAAVFGLALSAPSPQSVTVGFATANGTALSGSDYDAATGSVTIPAATTTGSLSVAVRGDTVLEADETFFVNLSGPAGAILTDSEGKGTIANDDVAALPGLSIGDVSVTEGNAGTTAAAFLVALSAPAADTVTFSYTTVDGTANAGGDYAAAAGTVSLAAGETSIALPVTVFGDTVVEPDETFLVKLTSVIGATLADGQGLGTIRNDDTAVRPGAEIVSPVPGSTFTSSVVTFHWTAGTGVSAYGLEIGSAPGASDLYRRVWLDRLSTTVTLPTDGRTVYVRLWSLIGGVQSFNEYTYTAARR